MPTKYPAELDNFVNPGPKTSQAVSRTHSQQHSDLNDAVEAIQAALGTLPGSGTLALKSDLASSAAGKGSEIIGFRDTLATAYLKTVSDIINGSEVSLHRFIPTAQHAAIRAGTSTYDAGNDIRSALLETGTKSLFVPYGLHNYSGNLPRTGVGLVLRGASHQHSILRCVGAGGITFAGGDVTGIEHNKPKLDLSNLRIEAGVENAGTAVSMTYVAGNGTPPLGATWQDVVIAPSNNVVGPGGPGFNRGVYGFNLRDVHFKRITVAGNSSTAPHPLAPTMTEGMFFDGDGDAIELWLSEVYAYYLQTGIKVKQHEGVYIDRMTSLAIWHAIHVTAGTPEPVAHVTNSYLGSERTGIIMDMMSFAKIHGNTFNPTAPVPNANYRGLVLDRSDAVSNNQLGWHKITNNTFIGVDYKERAGGHTETAIDVISANVTDIVDNDILNFDVGVQVAANALNVQIRCKNRYRDCDVNESIPRATRKAAGGDIRLRAEIGATQSFAVNTWTKINMTNLLESKGGAYYNQGTATFSPPGGMYRSQAQVRFSNVGAGDFCGVALYKNGSIIREMGQTAINGNAVVVALDVVIEAQAADTFEIWGQVSAGSGTRDVLGVGAQTFWDMYALND